MANVQKVVGVCPRAARLRSISLREAESFMPSANALAKEREVSNQKMDEEKKNIGRKVPTYSSPILSM